MVVWMIRVVSKQPWVRGIDQQSIRGAIEGSMEALVFVRRKTDQKIISRSAVFDINMKSCMA